MNGDVCRVEDCDKPSRSRGWCNNHYNRWLRKGHPLGRDAVGVQRTRATTEKRCANCGEVKTRRHFYVAKKGTLSAYCKPCHAEVVRENHRKAAAKRRAENPRKPSIRELDCSFPGCTNKARTKVTGELLCASHYNQAWRGQELTPLRQSIRSYIDENHRRCTGCLVIKTPGDFHTRNDGTPQQRCKPCMVFGNRWAFLMRVGRVEDAVEVVERMPEPLRELYRGKTAERIKESELERSNEKEPVGNE